MSIRSLKLIVKKKPVIEKYLRTVKSQVESHRFLIYCQFPITTRLFCVCYAICQYVIRQKRIITNQSCEIAFLKTSYNLGKNNIKSNMKRNAAANIPCAKH